MRTIKEIQDRPVVEDLKEWRMGLAVTKNGAIRLRIRV